MKRNRLKIKGLLLILSLPWGVSHGTGVPLVDPPESPRMALKSNLLSDVTTSLSLAMELKVHTNMTLDLPIQYNPWSLGDNKKIKHFLFQPEVRYWPCQAFNRHFVGVHLHGGLYNVGGIGFSDYMKDHRFEGWMIGGGISYGYHWILSDRWSIEATIGLGYAYLDYEVFPCESCGSKMKDKTMHYFGPTKAAVSFVYVLK